ncbi:hypothetical protein [Halomonas sp. NO4]|uniref:hypothetical protein n=1 Tax=Halomonas sp. NO4 TaxID=2484813 RepID=UPI0013D25A91|nr:hypothetical protein [Halomonas sp. NO4]
MTARKHHLITKAQREGLTATEVIELAGGHEYMNRRCQHLGKALAGKTLQIENARRHYEATSELHTTWEECAAAMYDCLDEDYIEQAFRHLKASWLREIEESAFQEHDQAMAERRLHDAAGIRIVLERIREKTR